MAYRDFKEKDLREKFQLRQRIQPIFQNERVTPVQPSQRLLHSLEDAKLITLSTEKALSERVIAPILSEIKRLNPKTIQIFSGEVINGDKNAGLNGEIDFIITRRTDTIEPQAPILSVTEAKIGRVDKAIPQAAAQMLGARLFNQENNEPIPVIHGIITDGTSWLMLRLENSTLTVNDHYFYTIELNNLLGVLQRIISLHT
jgi:hypothetical protein